MVSLPQKLISMTGNVKLLHLRLLTGQQVQNATDDGPELCLTQEWFEHEHVIKHVL